MLDGCKYIITPLCYGMSEINYLINFATNYWLLIKKILNKCKQFL